MYNKTLNTEDESNGKSPFKIRLSCGFNKSETFTPQTFIHPYTLHILLHPYTLYILLISVAGRLCRAEFKIIRTTLSF